MNLKIMKTSRNPFYLALIDDDKSEFSVVGPTNDDSVWTKRTSDLQNKGRKVRTFSFTARDSDELQNLIPLYAKQLQMPFVKEPIF